MTARDFTTEFTVEQSPEEAITAIKNVRGWWSEGVQGSADHVGDEFAYRHGDVHRSKQRLIELVPGQRVVWRVVDNHLSFIADQNEWKDTQLRFDVSEQGGKTKVRFTHVGLVPRHECYQACSNAWSFYVGESLRDLITTGKGQPDEREKPES